jgi:hypothetical protein
MVAIDANSAIAPPDDDTRVPIVRLPEYRKRPPRDDMIDVDPPPATRREPPATKRTTLVPAAVPVRNGRKQTRPVRHRVPVTPLATHVTRSYLSVSCDCVKRAPIDHGLLRRDSYRIQCAHR